MAKNDPDAAALLEAVAEMLQTQFLPKLNNSELKYQSRVALSVLGIVGRELELGEAVEHQEVESLQKLLGVDGAADELNRLLVTQIRAGKFDDDAEALMTHFRASILAKIAIDNPTYPTYQTFQDSGKLRLP